MNCFTSQWAEDGSALYSNIDAGAGRCALEGNDHHKLVYFRIDLNTDTATKIDGGYQFNETHFTFTPHYIEDGKKIDLSYPCSERSCGHLWSDPLIAGGNSAYMEEKSIGAVGLFIKVDNSPPLMIEAGYSSFCEGTNLRVVSWLDDGNYLLYVFNGNTYIYGVKEKRKSVLSQLSGQYSWLPIDSTHVKFIDGSSHQADPNAPLLHHPSHMY